LSSEPVRLQETVRFGQDVELDLRAYELRRAGRVLKLERIPLEILLFLIEQRGALVTRAQIVERIWGKDIFLDTDNSINGAIRKIRQVLRDNPEQPHFVQTVTGRGYRFIAPVFETSKSHLSATEPAPAHGSSNGDQTAAIIQDDLPANGTGATVSPKSKRRILRTGLLALGTLLVVATASIAVNLLRNRPVPFESVKTTRLTSAGQSAKAAISPDGAYIAHTLLVSGQESLRVRRSVMTEDVEIVPPQPVRYLGITFSPDSRTLYYVMQKAGDEPGTLYRIPVIGGVPQKLKEHLDSGITFSPEGTKFAFIRESATESALMIADLDASSEELVVSRKLPEVLDYPAWSADGRLIAFTDTDASIASPRGSDARIMQVRLATRREELLSRQKWGFVKELAWLRDGRGLVISARGREESGFFHLWFLSYPDGIGRQITEGLYRQRGVSISADSRQIVTVQENAFSSVWRLQSLRASNPELVVTGESGTSAPVWTPDGRIVFEEELTGRRSIWTVSADGTNRRELTLTGNNYDHSISGDGRELAFVSDRSGVPAIWTMDMDTGNSTMLVKATGEPVPQLSPDGKWIAYTAIGSEHWTTLWRTPSSGRNAVELNDRFWLRPAISPDGKWIAAFYADGQLNTQTKPTSIAIMRSDGRRPSKVIHIPFSVLVSGGIRWRPDGKGISYINRSKEGDNIWFQSLNEEAPRQITKFQGFDLFSFDWSLNGKQLAFSRGILARDVILIQQEKQ
jgi:Tol biopolymer transport system component/DNA-binding winged helix-turn-helix (wHTH) protein